MSGLEHIFGEVEQEGITITPTDSPGEWEFRAKFNEPRQTEGGFELRRNSDDGTTPVLNIDDCVPWKVETWLEALACEVGE